jgi:hypothetical protein
MPTTTTGTFFVRKTRPRVEGAGSAFKLTLFVLDKQAHGAEPYAVTWTGDLAAHWWREHGARIHAGTPLALVLHNPRSFPGMNSPETHATVHSCALAPLAPSWQAHAVGRPPHQPHAA